MQDSMITTSSATVGGLTKAFILGFAQPTITFPQILEVSIYAAISATIGYGIKMLFDEAKIKLRKRKARKNESSNETNEKIDFELNLSEINVALLKGFGNTEREILEDILLSDLDQQGLGSLTNQQADERMYKYLVSTRAFAAQNKASIAHYERSESFIKSLDYAIKYWHTSKREEALTVLS